MHLTPMMFTSQPVGELVQQCRGQQCQQRHSNDFPMHRLSESADQRLGVRPGDPGGCDNAGEGENQKPRRPEKAQLRLQPVKKPVEIEQPFAIVENIPPGIRRRRGGRVRCRCRSGLVAAARRDGAPSASGAGVEVKSGLAGVPTASSACKAEEPLAGSIKPRVFANTRN